ncbi:MAG: hypothetical protein M1816_000154 [Peltula sp. TS41687]|nr:MAG: hypothetical protein M1816_000154 [Peltula sp. TS41687]
MPRIVIDLEPYKDFIVELYQANCPMVRICAKLKESHDIKVSPTTVRSRLTVWDIPKPVPTKEERHLKNEWALSEAPLSQLDAHSNLIASLTRIVNEQAPDKSPPEGWERTGLFIGPTGIAYLFFRLSTHYPELRIQGHRLATWAQRYLDIRRSQYHTLANANPTHCGISHDLLAVTAVDAAMHHQDWTALQRFCNQIPAALEPGWGSDEWLYGRAGLLYLIRMVKEHRRHDAETQTTLQRMLDAVVARILQTPRPWKWLGKEYYGAVHGTIGIITQCLLSSPLQAAERLEPDLLAMLAAQDPAGNWPPSVRGRSELVQFCHGAPGFVLALLSLRDHYLHLQDRIDDAVEKGRACIWKRGLLVKEPCLCHGISGNALALESPRFEHFLSFTTQDYITLACETGYFRESDAPYSLMGGEAERAWAWAVADLGLEKNMIGFNDL